MKYMGSKRRLLENGLGQIVVADAARSKRFVDLFCGTGRVAWHVAESVKVPVLAYDLQYFASLLAGAVIERSAAVDFAVVEDIWLGKVRRYGRRTPAFKLAMENDSLTDSRDVELARRACEGHRAGPIWNAYGGHYFSPRQAATFDALLRWLPEDGSPLATFCRALVVLAASRCAAAPGHTAQPFQPTPSAMPYIVASWRRDPLEAVETAFGDVSQRYARVPGMALVADANQVACSLGDGDTVFVDPPYSAVQYSRFYHVLETVARKRCGPVAGVGRYPPVSERPISAYSMKSQASSALADLLRGLSMNGCNVILTFPQGNASNGLNGEELIELAREWFLVEATVVASRFSTMGGNNQNRSARRRSGEVVVRMKPV